jgi:hypothetical protein
MDEFANAIAQASFDRIKPVVEKMDSRVGLGCDRSSFMVTFVMAWSPLRRFNAGRFEVELPGDYATLNSYEPRDGTGGFPEARGAEPCYPPTQQF